MSVARHFHIIPLLLGMTIALLYPHSAPARSTTSPTSIVESKLGGETILSAPASKLISVIEDCVKENPLRAGHIVQAVLGGGRADADAIAPQVTASAILGLGKNPAPTSVADIIYFSVKATPTVVLETVKASVKVAPGFAKTIVRAAVKAIPNPNDKIQPIGETPSNPDTGYAKDEKDQPSVDNNNNDTVLPIAEAIAMAAQAGDPSLSLDDLMNTANQASQESRNGTFTNINTYPGYYYPPLVTANPSPSPSPIPSPSPTPAAMPSPPVVSK